MNKVNELKWKKPSIMTYVYESYMLGIMEAYGDDYKEWMLSNYIQLNCHDNIYKDRDVFLAFYGDVGIYSPYLKVQKLSWSFVRTLGVDLKSLFKKSIDIGCYLYFKLDEYYVPNRRTFGKSHYIHDNLILGYDEEGFIVFGYNCKGICEKNTINYNQLILALESIITDIDKEQWEDRMYILQYQKADYHLNIDLIKESLYDYIHSINRKDKLKRFSNPLSNTVYGLATYDKVIEYLNYLVDGDDSFNEGALIGGNAHIDNRIFRIIMEHKNLMLKRIEYLSKKMDNLEDIIEEYKKIRKIAEANHYLAVKYQLTAEKKTLYKIIENVELIKNSDGEVLGKLHDML
ncbi:hypothetical protein [Ruminococcus sp.]|uniref:hypothetical protein n=1 Tax=Ruminococcus sp. TaxID=41978 RepID=UPI0038905357